MKAVELKKLLKQSRELCPGMTGCDYLFAECLADNLPDSDGMITPSDVVSTMKSVREDLIRYRKDHDAVIQTKAFPDDFKRFYNMALASMKYVLQIIDLITEPMFSREVRDECFELGWSVPYMPKISSAEDIPFSSVKCAADWWIKKIQSPGEAQQSIGENLTGLSEEQIKALHLAIAELITHKLCRYGSVSIDVDGSPDQTITQAIQRVKLDPSSFKGVFPQNTSMLVHQDFIYIFSKVDNYIDAEYKRFPDATISSEKVQ